VSRQRAVTIATTVVALLGLRPAAAQSPETSPAGLSRQSEGPLKDLKGDRIESTHLDTGIASGRVPIEIDAPEPPAGRPSGEVVSVAQLRHKVPKRARKDFERANRLSRAGEHKKAVKELEAAIARDPDYAAAYDQLGVEYGDLGQLNTAEAKIRHSLALDPTSWRGYYNLGVIRLRTGDAAGAEKNAQRALTLSKGEPKAHLMLGMLLCLHPETWSAGLEHVRIAARTMPEAERALRDLEAKFSRQGRASAGAAAPADAASADVAKDPLP
jgi:Flp pilus assembly protein TadD